jgi:predicted enzyme related to lactoylglutathione lyase
MANQVVEWQIVSLDPDASTSFCHELFGWEVDADNSLGYRRFATGSADDRVGGVWPSPPEGRTFVQLFVAVPDVAAAVARATSLGAQVAVPPQLLPDGDEMAVIVGPDGLAWGLVKRA